MRSQNALRSHCSVSDGACAMQAVAHWDTIKGDIDRRVLAFKDFVINRFESVHGSKALGKKHKQLKY